MLRRRIRKLALDAWLSFNETTYCNWLVGQLKQFYDSGQSARVRKSLRSCGQNVTFQFPLYFAQPEEISIGDDVAFAAFVHIWGAGGLSIGNRVMIGSHTAISTVTHDYDKHQMYGTIVTKRITIHDDVWIGAHAFIMPGIEIGRGAVVGAGSVVTKDVQAGSIVGGVPARLLRMRNAHHSNELSEG